MDRVILGAGCYLDDEPGSFRPNNNQVVVGCPGTGKSFSSLLPTILNMQEDSLVASYSKPGDAHKIGKYLKRKGYNVEYCDLANPTYSTVSFDPLHYVSSDLDIEELASSIVLANPNSGNEKDAYWNDGAICLLSALIDAVVLAVKDPCMADVIDLFDRFKIEENGKGVMTSLDNFFAAIEKKHPSSRAVANFNDICMLPYSTCGCIRDTLAKALRRMFPKPIISLMRQMKNIDFHEIANKKSALIIITSPVNPSLYYFANLIFGSGAIKQLLEYAETLPDQRLPRHVRFLFDDFACAAPINNFSQYISIMRYANLSVMLLIQSETQLTHLYDEASAATILNCCSSYTYFPGGMDLATCKSISQRLDVPLSDVMFAPPGKVIVMRAGEKPMIVARYNTLESPEYKEYMKSTTTKSRPNTSR